MTVAGVQLNNNTALTTKIPEITKMRKKKKELTEKWRNCGWSGTQQQHRKRETKRTVIQSTSNPVEFSLKTSTKTRSDSRRIGETVAGVELQQQHRKHETGTQKQGRKIQNRLEMSVHNGHVRVVTWRVAA